nr:MAG TPA: hypothetical protein [Caudoviricetes sp.]
MSLYIYNLAVRGAICCENFTPLVQSISLPAITFLSSCLTELG